MLNLQTNKLKDKGSTRGVFQCLGHVEHHIHLILANSSVKHGPHFHCFICVLCSAEKHFMQLLLLLPLSSPCSWTKQLNQYTPPNPSNPKTIPIGGPCSAIVNSCKPFPRPASGTSHQYSSSAQSLLEVLVTLGAVCLEEQRCSLSTSQAPCSQCRISACRKPSTTNLTTGEKIMGLSLSPGKKIEISGLIK